ncbi:hypothetical protein EVAR_82699_1 [Eumeta japonica]|uniref:Uncharacterized protein n=1 Tax=Eumeta variegata TaxID=151549 RepID=A0A4C1VCU9_EUMVA|nr:hypothetical protein EVAR_82699_1 [Eumeta japonica]
MLASVNTELRQSGESFACLLHSRRLLSLNDSDNSHNLLERMLTTLSPLAIGKEDKNPLWAVRALGCRRPAWKCCRRMTVLWVPYEQASRYRWLRGLQCVLKRDWETGIRGKSTELITTKGRNEWGNPTPSL